MRVHLPFLQKETDFFDFLFASLDDEVLQKRSTLKGKQNLDE